MTEQAVLDAITDDFYLAAERPDHWASVGRNLAQAFGGHQSMTFRRTDLALGNDLVIEGMDPALANHYGEIVDHDLWLQAMIGTPTPSVRRSEDIVDLRTLHRSVLYNELCRPADVEHMINAVGASSPQAIVGFAVQRSKRAGAFTRSHERALMQLLPHYQRAVRLEHMLRAHRSESSMLRNVLDHHHLANFVLDSEGRLLASNTQANRLLAAGDGLVMRSGKLTAYHASDNAHLQTAVRMGDKTALDKHPPLDLVVQRKSPGANALLLALFPLNERHGTHAPGATTLIFVLDPAKPPPLPWNGIAQLYGLTKSELKLARLLVRGLNLAECADTLGVALATVRSQLKSLFRKTDSHSQTQLLLLLLRTSGTTTED